MKRYLSNVGIIIAGILLGVLLFVSYRYLGAQQSQGLVTPGASLLKLPEIEVLTVTREKYDLSNLANHRFILMMVDGNGYSCEQQLEILAGLKMTIDNMNAVVLFASAPDPGVLEKIQDKQITLLVDEEGKIGRMTGISSLPMVLFVSEELNICAMRGPVSTNLISNFSSVVQQFVEGKELTNTAMNLFKPGDVLPIFVTQSKACNEPLLQEKLAAKHVIIHFSTTCSPCISELCALRKFIDAGNSVSVLGITTSSKADTAVLLEDIGLSFPVIYDTEKEITNKHDVSCLPTVFLVDDEGTILEKVVGYNEKVFHNILEEASYK